MRCFKSPEHRAETAYQTVTEILAEPEHDFLPGPTLKSYLNHIQKNEAQATKTWNKADRDLHTFRAQRIRWDLKNVERRLAKAQKELEALCPTGTCVEEGDQVLWDLLKLQTEYEFWQTTTPELECKIDLYDWKDRVPQDHSRHHNCIRKRRREYDWFAQAIEQTKEEALAHCTKTGCSLLPIPTLEELVDKRIEELEDDIVRLNEESKLFEDYIQKFSPTSLDKEGQAWADFERWHSGVVNGPHYAREQTDYLRSELRGGGDRNRLRRHIDTANRW